MQKILSTLSFCLITSCLMAQFHNVNSNNEKQNIKHHLDVSALREQIYNGIPDSLRLPQFDLETYLFCNDNAASIENLVSKGAIYNWPELENYLNEILKRVLPKELKSDSNIHVYVLDDGYPNAFMTPSGHIFFTIGMMDGANSEAFIASVLTHELAHYSRRHSVQWFMEKLKGTYGGNILTKTNAESNHSISHEFEADSLSIVWLAKAGYHVNAETYVMEYLARLEKNNVARSPDKFEIKSETHPKSTARIEQADRIMKLYTDDSAKIFLIDIDKFFKLKELSKYEILKSHIDNMEYNSCIEKSFRFHLFDPENPEYAYYIMEGIRRMSFISDDFWDKNFITWNYYDSVIVEGLPKKLPMKSNLFEKFDFNILPMDIRDAAKIKAKFYWKDQPRFRTNIEAFDYFYLLGEKLNYSECMLTNALSFTQNKKLRNQYLEKYILQPKTLYSEFAKNLLHDSIFSQLPTKTICYVRDVWSYVRLGKQDLKITIQKENTTNNFQPILDSMSVIFKDIDFRLFESLKWESLSDYRLLKSLANRTFYSARLNKELFIINPQFWYLFQHLKANEIRIITSDYFEARKSEKKIDEIRNVLNTSFYDIYNQEKRDRFMTFQVIVARIKPVLMPKMVYFAEAKFNFKENGYLGLKKEFISVMNGAEKELKYVREY